MENIHNNELVGLASRRNFKGSLTIKGVGMFMSLFERNYKD